MSEQSPFDALEQLIAREKQALLDGDFDTIGELVEEKEVLIAELNGTETDANRIEPLRAGIRRNQELFDHALAGLRNVATRLGDLNRARKSIGTYDALGRKHEISVPAKKKLEKRA